VDKSDSNLLGQRELKLKNIDNFKRRPSKVQIFVS